MTCTYSVISYSKGGIVLSGIFNGDDFALILVLFVLLVIVGCDCN
jgi:uncharacterized protein (TIGR01732 family)